MTAADSFRTLTLPHQFFANPRLSVLLVLVLLPIGAVAQISEAEFTSDFVEVIRRSSLEISTEEPEPLHLKVGAPNGTEHDVYLDNAYALYLQDIESLQEILDQYAESLLETIMYDGSGVSESDIVPVVKDIGWLNEVLNATGGSDLPDYIQRPLVDGLIVIYAEDTPSNIRFIEKSLVEETGIDTKSLAALSVENLMAKLPDIEIHGADGLYMVTAGGNYEASLLLVDEIWSAASFDVKGDIVVSIPARDVLLVSGSKETSQLEKLIDLTKSIFEESPYHLTMTLYVRRDNKWQPL